MTGPTTVTPGGGVFGLTVFVLSTTTEAETTNIRPSSDWLVFGSETSAGASFEQVSHGIDAVAVVPLTERAVSVFVPVA